jgi:hypothetical protein
VHSIELANTVVSLIGDGRLYANRDYVYKYRNYPTPARPGLSS